VALVLGVLLLVEDLVDVLLHCLVGQRGDVEELGLALDADHGDAGGLEVDVRAVDLDGGLEEVVELEAALLDANLGLAAVAAVAVDLFANGFRGSDLRHNLWPSKVTNRWEATMESYTTAALPWCGAVRRSAAAPF